MISKSIRGWGAAVALLLAYIPCEAATNLLQNGDLKLPEGNDPNPEAWELRMPFTGSRVEKEGAPGEYCLRLHANADDKGVFWVQKSIPLDPGGSYRFTYRVRAEPGQRYRAYVEFWAADRSGAQAEGAAWQKGTGEWEEKSFRFSYPEGKTPPYVALNVEAPGTVFFSDLSIINESETDDSSASSRTGGKGDLSLEAGEWTLRSDAALVDDPMGKAIRLKSPKKEMDPSIVRHGLSLSASQRYRLSYQVRGGEGSAESTGFQVFRVYVAWLGQAGEALPREGVLWQDCFDGWQTRSLEFTALSEGANKVDFVGEMKGPGTLFFRNFKLEPIEPQKKADLAIKITEPQYRNTLFGAQDSKIEGTILSGNHEPGPIEVSLEKEGRLVRKVSTIIKAGQEGASFLLPVSDLPTGDYRLMAVRSARKNSSSAPLETQAVSILKYDDRKSSVLIGADNVIHCDGKPFFPIFLWAAPRSHRQMHELNAAGFNVFRGVMSKTMLDKAADYNLKVVGDLVGDGLVVDETTPEKLALFEKMLKTTLQNYSTHPSLLAYYLADEPLWGGKPLSALLWTYETLRKLDPYHPVFINEAPRNTIEAVAEYGKACDIFGVDIYPVPIGRHSDLEDKSLSSVGKYTDRMRASVNDRKPIWMTLQGFSWLNLKDRKVEGLYPTWEESRFMAYNALVHGATGIAYWGTEYINDPDFWSILFRTTSEVRDLSAVLVSPSITDGSTRARASSIALLHKRHDGVDYIIAINESDVPVETAFSSRLAGETLHVHFENRSLPIKAGGFTDRFKPWDVHVYSIAEHLPAPLVPSVKDVPTDGESFLGQAHSLKTRTDFESQAEWIWSEKNPKPKSIGFFRRALQIKPGLRKATLMITGDDYYHVYLNGIEIGSDLGRSQGGEGWTTVKSYDITLELNEGGKHLLSAEVEDAGQLPCGLLVDLRLEYDNGDKDSILSGADWKTSISREEGWTGKDFSDANWQSATRIVKYGEGPWKRGLELKPVTR